MSSFTPCNMAEFAAASPRNTAAGEILEFVKSPYEAVSKEFDDLVKARGVAAHLRTVIKKNNIDGVTVAQRGNRVFMIKKDSITE